MKTKTYKIVRHYAPDSRGKAREKHTVRGKTGLTLAQAQAHCEREDTHDKGEWFDAYTEET